MVPAAGDAAVGPQLGLATTSNSPETLSVSAIDASKPWPAGDAVTPLAPDSGLDLAAVKAGIDTAFDGDESLAVRNLGPVHVQAEASGIHEVFVYSPDHQGICAEAGHGALEAVQPSDAVSRGEHRARLLDQRRAVEILDLRLDDL